MGEREKQREMGERWGLALYEKRERNREMGFGTLGREGDILGLLD